MTSTPFDSDDATTPPVAEPDGQWVAPAAPESTEPPTVPGLDQNQTQQFPPQPKWQPLPGGWASEQQAPAGQPVPGQPAEPGNWPPATAPGWAPPQGGFPTPGYPAQGAYPQQGAYPAQGGYGQPQPNYGGYAGAGAAGAAAGYGYGYATPGGPGAPGGPGEGGSGSDEPKHSRRRVVAVGLSALAIVALVGTAAGVGIEVGRHHNTSSANSGPTAPQTIPSPSPTSEGTAQTRLNVQAIAAKVDPATVDITSVLGTTGEAEGTGIILTSNGEVLTNNHVVEGGTSITAQVEGVGTKYTVQVLGVDPTQDVALVQLKGASGLNHVSIGDSSQVHVGDGVVAIGNALGLGGTPTVTSGIVSALGRSINATNDIASSSEHLTGLIQTDAPINPGNSGGPLVDAAGQVIGMDTAAANGSSGESATNIGFAIPIDRAISIAQQIQQGKASSTVTVGTRGVMGVEVETIQDAEANTSPFGGGGVTAPVSSGAYVVQVEPSSPAAQAGLAAGSVIVGFDGKTVTSPTELTTDLTGAHPGTKISVTWVDSSGTRHSANLVLEGGPAL